MKIRYSKRRLLSNLVLGTLFVIWGTVKLFEETANYFIYFQLFLGSLMVASFFYEKKYQYLTIENGFLTKNSLRSKTIQLDKIEQVQSFPGKIKVFTHDKSLSINREIIDKNSIQDLYAVLGSLELDPEENPFIGYSRNSS